MTWGWQGNWGLKGGGLTSLDCIDRLMWTKSWCRVWSCLPGYLGGWLFRLPVATTTTTTMCPGVTMVLVGVLNMNMIDCGLGGVVPTNVANSVRKWKCDMGLTGNVGCEGRSWTSLDLIDSCELSLDADKLTDFHFPRSLFISREVESLSLVQMLISWF